VNKVVIIGIILAGMILGIWGIFSLDIFSVSEDNDISEPTMEKKGGSSLSINGYFKKISNTEGFIGVGSKSDQNDKYSKIPHTSYEFKIPLNLFDRSNIYGFYVLVFDASTNQYYSWPTSILPDGIFDIPSPSKWGELVSPDKSIPEFNLPLLVLIPALFMVIYFTRFLQKPKRG